ncbi:hypothetical protein QTP86_018473 [Hemibagrus guttatus]|nr:hypothetical protein QTP86_018473 [Hemibagrus guttatus]
MTDLLPQGRIHPGWSADPSQGTHIHTLIHSHSLETLINLQCMSLDRGRKPEYPEETPRHGENMQTPHTHGRGGNRTPNPGGVRLTTKPPCSPYWHSI